MESKWIEDFLKLAELGHFSRAAEVRCLSQPAFSRRIQSLEAWVGTALIDRNTYPLRLTRAGELFRDQAAELLRQILETRSVARGIQVPALAQIHFAATHTISLTFFPRWLASLNRQRALEKSAPIKAKMTAANLHDAAAMLTEKHCDLLLCYHHAELSADLDPDVLYEMARELSTPQPSSGFSCHLLKAKCQISTRCCDESGRES